MWNLLLKGRAYGPVHELLEREEVNHYATPLCISSIIQIKILYMKVLRSMWKLQYSDISRNCNWAYGIRNSKYPGVPLYQDAHGHIYSKPPPPPSGGKNYEPHRCWEDVFMWSLMPSTWFTLLAGLYTEIAGTQGGKSQEVTLPLANCLRKKQVKVLKFLCLFGMTEHLWDYWTKTVCWLLMMKLFQVIGCTLYLMASPSR